jgi:hypothetical protein
MRNRVGMSDTLELATRSEQDIAQALTQATADVTQDGKLQWRGQIVNAGLGVRLANTVQAKTFPAGVASLDPAGWIWTKAPNIIDAFDRGPTILPTDGRYYLAIPTSNVPRRGGKRMSPLDVEVAYNQDLIIKPGRSGNLFAFVDAAFGRFSRAQGRAYGRQRAPRRPGKPQLVLMFTLVRMTRLRKRISVDAVADYISSGYPGRLALRWSAIPDRSASMKGL